jgi:hypothetical protein
MVNIQSENENETHENSFGSLLGTPKPYRTLQRPQFPTRASPSDHPHAGGTLHRLLRN